MIFIALGYITLYSLSIFGGFELIKKCKQKDEKNNDNIIDLDNITLNDISKIKEIIDPSNNKLKKNDRTDNNLKEIYPIHDIIEEIDVESIEKNISDKQPIISHVPHWTGNFKPRAFF